MKTLETLKAELAEAEARCQRYARPAHAVRNCISDQEHETEAWRDLKRIEYQIQQLSERKPS